MPRSNRGLCQILVTSTPLGIWIEVSVATNPSCNGSEETIGLTKGGHGVGSRLLRLPNLHVEFHRGLWVVEVQSRAEPAFHFLDLAIDLESALVHIPAAVLPNPLDLEVGVRTASPRPVWKRLSGIDSNITTIHRIEFDISNGTRIIARLRIHQ
jgi:hypothetical protein